MSSDQTDFRLSQMDARGGYDQADAHGNPGDGSHVQVPSVQSHNQPKKVEIKAEDLEAITHEEFISSEYKRCHTKGKAVIVSNFMEGYKKRDTDIQKVRESATDDCNKLEKLLKDLGFEPLDQEEKMVYKNLTKAEFTNLYNKVAREVNYRQKGKGYTCVLFIVMSYGRPGLIRCHAEKDGMHPFIEQKDLQEAFQPQNNPSLALKPKLFIIQTVPEEGTISDAPGEPIKRETKRIPRESDFLTYTSESYCFNRSTKTNWFIEAVVKTLESLKKETNTKMEIQKVLIRINKEFKDLRADRTDWKIPCTTSSLTKQLYLFEE